MVFVEYSYGTYKKEIRELLRKRLALKDKIRFYRKKIAKFEEKINQLNTEDLVKVEEELNTFLKKAGN